MRKGDLGDKRRDKGEAVGVHLLGYGGVDVFCDVVLLGKDLVEGVDGNGRAQGVGDEIAHLGDWLLQHVVALVDAGLLGRGAKLIAHVVLRGDLEADGYVVLGLHVDVKAVFHGAEAYRGCLAVHEGNLGVETRAHNLVELAQALDDHGMLLLDHEEDIAGEGKDNKEKDENPKDAADGCKNHVCSLERADIVLDSTRYGRWRVAVSG